MPEPVPYRLPDLGEGMAEAEIVRWEVEVGAHVRRDQVVVHVQTDKAEVELPVPEAGTITALGGAVGDLLPVGAVLLELVPDQSPAATPPAATPPAATSSAPAAPEPEAASRGPAPDAASAPPAPSARVEAPPPVRKLARELGIDLAALTGTGPHGRITAADVRAAAGAVADEQVRFAGEDTPDSPAPLGGTRREPLRGIRRAMARNMADAWRDVPHISLFDEIDARPLRDALRAARELSGDQSLTYTALFVRATAIGLREHPILNAAYDADADDVVYHDAAHIGIAVALPHGLVVPVVRDAGTRSLLELGAEIARATETARRGPLSPEAIAGATFTLSNYGTEGGRFATPIVRPPQVGIFGCGAIRVRPVVDGDAVVAAPALPLALSVDHRVVDGHDATAFIDRMATLLRAPLDLLVDAGEGAPG
jgi:pyruvate/2-oxoglutarate dehydrogenase complex dihydrolipoamide acyltransferase (E2) component